MYANVTAEILKRSVMMIRFVKAREDMEDASVHGHVMTDIVQAGFKKLRCVSTRCLIHREMKLLEIRTCHHQSQRTGRSMRSE